MLLTWVMATSWAGSDRMRSDRLGIPVRSPHRTAAAATNQNAVEAFKCNEHEANSLPLSSPTRFASPTSTSPPATAGSPSPQLIYPSLRLRLSANLANFQMSISSDCRWGWCHKKRKKIKKKLVKSDLRAIFGLFEGVWTTKPVWPINTSITTQLFQHSGRTDTDPGTLGGPVALLVRFWFIWASISRWTNLFIYLLLIIVGNHKAVPPLFMAAVASLLALAEEGF